MSEKDFIKSTLELLKIFMVGSLGAFFVVGNSIVQQHPSNYQSYITLLGGLGFGFISFSFAYMVIAYKLTKLE